MKLHHSIIIIVVGLCLSACPKKSDPAPKNEEEVITTLTYTLKPKSGDNVVFKFTDKDGDGGNAPVIVNDTLKANTVYTGTFELLNEQASPAEDVTKEINEEADEHQFFFEINSDSLTVAYDDKDANGKPVGLKSILTTKGKANGTLKITLRHKPNKSAAGVSDGKITNAGGDTDIETSFKFYIEN